MGSEDGTTTDTTGLRERKKRATREALQAAALRLALQHGYDNVRVEDIAEAAGVSPRTYNNYFPSREHAIVAAVVADRAARIAVAVTAGPAGAGLGDTVIEAVAGAYTASGAHPPQVLAMLAASPALRACYADTATTFEARLADAITARHRGVGALTAEVLAAGVAAATKVALHRWLRPTDAVAATPGFVVPSGSLPQLVREALAPLAPALDAAAGAHRD